jgi:hypothetical protein
MYVPHNPSKEEQTAHASKYPQGYFKPKECKGCSNAFIPKAPSELYCSDKCKDAGYASAYLQRTYGITVNDYKDMLKEQDSSCKICGKEGWVMTTNHKMRLVVDHCHTTGKVRGLLCHKCNQGLGLFQDSVENLTTAASYIQQHQH